MACICVCVCEYLFELLDFLFDRNNIDIVYIVHCTLYNIKINMTIKWEDDTEQLNEKGDEAKQINPIKI